LEFSVFIFFSFTDEFDEGSLPLPTYFFYKKIRQKIKQLIFYILKNARSL